jgi:hypothetical protein
MCWYVCLYGCVCMCVWGGKGKGGGITLHIHLGSCCALVYWHVHRDVDKQSPLPLLYFLHRFQLIQLRCLDLFCTRKAQHTSRCVQYVRQSPLPLLYFLHRFPLIHTCAAWTSCTCQFTLLAIHTTCNSHLLHMPIHTSAIQTSCTCQFTLLAHANSHLRCLDLLHMPMHSKPPNV